MMKLPIKRNRFVLFQSTVAIAMLAVAVLTTMEHPRRVRFSANAIPFESAVWQNPYAGAPVNNLVMLDDFIDRYRLVGLTRQRVHLLLGTGMNTESLERIYVAGGSCTDASATYLEIEFAGQDPFQEQKAAKYRLVTERCNPPTCIPSVEATAWFN
jgi:hypothetical protein